ncbi:uncharacterized protein PV09_00626 [Verruconis gallopava]|uniref:Malate dehydrogenase n=1 Tax=Verruconis gallopava TaxID=253628 RepID=A0A0D2AQ91_9PEZI|nr:uncharacterized protein PV09_00626 [Verruconis gallopava]KIW08675.1 hypothetical protein PV09_00626 [Verruconis gallopava]
MISSHLFAVVACLSTFASALAIPGLSAGSSKRAFTVSLPPSGLPDPSSISPAVTLKYIALGVGTQNYTCASSPNSASAPIQVGAKATLFDAGQFFNTFPGMVQTLPGLALGLYTMTGQPDMTRILGGSVLGHHFFNSLGQPTFDLSKINARLTAKKLSGVAAPADSCPGPNNAGAVDWLELTDIGGGASYGGITYVYRVETAGGKPPAKCTDQSGAFTVPYAAEYWFYG